MEKSLADVRPASEAARVKPTTCLAIVIPSLREAETIGAVLERTGSALHRLGINYELIVVDDNSQDGTENIVRNISQTDARVRLLVRTEKRGLAGAILYGWQHSDAEVVGVIDADLQHPPEVLVELWRKMEQGYDLVIASRYALPGGMADWNLLRRWLSQITTALTWFVQKPSRRVRDPLSGFFLVRRSCIAGLDLQEQGFKLLLEILVRGRIGSVAEVPFVFGPRRGGASKASFKTGFDFLYLLSRLWRQK